MKDLKASPSTSLGILCGLGAALIWGAWPVVTSIGVKESITPVQVVMLRFMVAGVLLAPFAFRGPSSLKGWGKALVLAICAGTPYTLLVTTAFQHAPASHGGVVIPGTVMFLSLVAAHVWLGDKLTRTRAFGGFMITLGLAALAGGAAGGVETLRGDLLFMAGGVMWASYTFLLRHWPMDGLVVASRVAVISLIFVGILATFGFGQGLMNVPIKTIMVQGLWQGVLSAIVALVMFNRAVGILGSGRATIINALTPVIAVLLSFFILGEIPTLIEFAGLLTIMAGIAVALGIRLKRLKKPKVPATQLPEPL
ncbi:DMT family transporter [Kordiimonas aestuarii]|uniref:DMT family transporter n=1 Tax=Kordiimonas aestuarii TaxID=1005925 RepID=UPI0021D07AAD|nr:DMT family transporter [Kordiimonas aestuarii]